MWLSPTRCALAVGGNRFLSWIRILRCDYSRVTSVSYTSSDSSIEPEVFAQCVRATLAQLLGSASPDVRLRVRGIAVTDSVRFCGGGIDSFLGFEYGVVITLASHMFEYFFLFFLRACGFCAFLPSLGSQGVVTPAFLACPHVFSHVRSLYWVFRLLWRSPGLLLRGHRSPGRLLRRFFCSALRSAALLAVFSRISRFSC